MMELDRDVGIVKIIEEIGGSRGTEYYYIEINGLLHHIGKYFRQFRNFVYSSRGGKRKSYEYRIPFDEFKRFGDIVKIYRFRFSNKGYGPWIKIFEIDCVNRDIIERERVTMNDVNFKIDSHDVMNRIRTYQKYVPDFIRRVKDIQNRLRFNIAITGAIRLEDIYNDPNNAWKTAIVFSENKARVRALESYIQSSHELYVLMLVAEALNGKTISGYGTPTWWIEKGQDYSTAVVELNERKFTVWYQFSVKRWIDVVFVGLMRMFNTSEIVNELQKKAIEGEFKIFERLFGVKPKDVKEAYDLIREAGKLGQRQYVMPDIVVFEGEYRRREEIKENPPKMALIIDAKIEISDNDVQQILAYKRVFDETLNGCQTKYIVACLEMSSIGHKNTLEQNGVFVIENVAPDKRGEKEFKEILRKALEL